MINNIYKRQDLIKLLHKVISNKELTNKQTYLSYSDINSNKQYFLATTIELIMKYCLLEIDKVYIEQFVNELDYLLDKDIEYIDYLKQANQLLLNYVTTKLAIEDPTLTENKQKILDYTYNVYIKQGYYFATFLNKDIDKVESTGLSTFDYYPLFKKMEEIEEIYLRRKLSHPFGISVTSIKKDYTEITDSLAIAYFQGLELPKYLSVLTCTNNKMQTSEYDVEAYLRKDLTACTNNIELFMTKNEFSDIEKTKIIKFVEDSFTELKINSKDIPIAMIKRSTIGKDELPDYEEILKEINNQDLVYSFSRIIDGRYVNEKKFTKVLPNSIELLSLPSYYKIISVPISKTKPTYVEPKKKLSEIRHYSMARGMVNVFALSGMIMFIVGLSILLIYAILGG